MCLKELCQQLHHIGELDLPLTQAERLDWNLARKRLRGATTVDLQELILRSLSASGTGHLFFLDSLDRIGPSHVGLLEMLLREAVVCAGTAHFREGAHFRKIWSAFIRIDVPPLTDQESGQLVNHLLQHYRIPVQDPEAYRREVIKSSAGNPYHIRNMVWLGSREKRVTREELSRVRRVEEGEYFNMGPLYIFAASMFTMAKIFSLGTDNREFYIYFSALGFLVYMAFRVFRTFFLFRPQRGDR
jgi:hypothetical protein